jgi:ArsR family transcriptional regulator, arsenate/arsenite/antimonite-responsive transcriptional repressor
LLFVNHFHNIGIMEDKDVIKALAALAQPHRLQAFRALVVAGPEGLTPGLLTEQLDIPANTLSFHLKELTAAGLITQTRDGRHLIYRAAFEQMNALLAYLTANCCQGAACDVASPGTACC